MPITAIVAIPPKDDHVWDISSEKVPHLTLCILGDQSSNPKLQHMIEYVQHLASITPRFGMSVRDRGVLGPEEADVLFFSQWGSRRAEDLRSFLLEDDAISIAYNSVEQYDGWTPHLTLGYPAKPAKKETRDYPISWVNFDRLAVWTGDFEGPEFPLKEEDDWELTMAAVGVEDLSHHGVKGMHWGVRRKNIGTPRQVTVSSTPRRLKTSGGEGHPAHSDARSAASLRRRAKKSGVHSLSNIELKTLNERLNLEQNFSRLNKKPKTDGQRFVEEQLKAIGKQAVAKIVTKAAVKVGASVV